MVMGSLRFNLLTFLFFCALLEFRFIRTADGDKVISFEPMKDY